MGHKILILGHSGMLGHMVLNYLKTSGYEVETTDLRWPSADFRKFIFDGQWDFIVNCIGAIHQKTQNFDINWELPIFLDFYSKSKIIHPGTDCESDETPYGRSKKIARDFIVGSSTNTKSLKTSIIGPELNSNSSLMCWFLSHRDSETVRGFSKQMWNGNTTLTWAKFCCELIEFWEKFSTETILYSECISKKEILDHLNNVFNRKIIVQDYPEIQLNKCLIGDIKTPHIKEQLLSLRKFYYDKD